METQANNNYLFQSNLFNETVLSDISEVQKDIIYYLQSVINFREEKPTGEVLFNYLDFLKYKNIQRNNAYTPNEIQGFCKELIKLNGVIYNIKTENIEFFNIIDKVVVSEKDPENFVVHFASWGKIFFFEKFAKDYAELSKIQYTQIEVNIIDLQSEKRKKLFELLSQFKETGIYRVPLLKLKTLLGFIIYDFTDNDTTIEKQLSLFDTGKKPTKEFLKTWYDFRKVFLDPAIEEINSKSKLDIHNITYSTIKKGNKIVSLEFKFKKRLKFNNLSQDQKNALKYLVEYGLSEQQGIFILQRLSAEEIFQRISNCMTFNNHYDNKESQYYRQKIFFDNETRVEIKNLGGFLYSKVFPELSTS